MRHIGTGSFRVFCAGGLLLLLLLALSPAWGVDALVGTVVRVNLDRTFDVRFSGRTPAVGDRFTLERDGEAIGEVVIRAVTATRVSGGPSEGFLGSPRLGDRLVVERSATPAAGASDWIAWSHPDAGFTITAPRHHESFRYVEKRGPFTITENIESFTDVTHRLTFKVLWFEIPVGFLESDVARQNSDAVRQELKKREYRVAGSRPLVFQGMQGVEGDVTLTDLWGRIRIFVTDRRWYQLYVISEYREVPRRPATRFFESFRLYSTAGRPLKAPPTQASRGRLCDER